jgi:hypothetical protein
MNNPVYLLKSGMLSLSAEFLTRISQGVDVIAIPAGNALRKLADQIEGVHNGVDVRLRDAWLDTLFDTIESKQGLAINELLVSPEPELNAVLLPMHLSMLKRAQSFQEKGYTTYQSQQLVIDEMEIAHRGHKLKPVGYLEVSRDI